MLLEPANWLLAVMQPRQPSQPRIPRICLRHCTRRRHRLQRRHRGSGCILVLDQLSLTSTLHSPSCLHRLEVTSSSQSPTRPGLSSNPSLPNSTHPFDTRLPMDLAYLSRMDMRARQKRRGRCWTLYLQSPIQRTFTPSTCSNSPTITLSIHGFWEAHTCPVSRPWDLESGSTHTCQSVEWYVTFPFRHRLLLNTSSDDQVRCHDRRQPLRRSAQLAHPLPRRTDA
jgi:hypothetical protein